MMGQKIKSGTGICDIYLDEEELYKNNIKEEIYYENENDIDNLLSVEDEGDCKDEDFKFSFD